MALQVGFWCYATQADAAAAACAAVVPSTTVSGGSVVTLSCSGVSAGGNIVMQTSAVPVDGSASAAVASVEQSVVFQPCVQPDYVSALELVFAAVLSAWAMWYGVKKVIDVLEWSRGDSA